MTLAKALQVAAGNSQESADIAEAIDFDGTNDLLSRSTDLVGNTDGQSFTLSFWLWRKNTSGLSAVYTAEASAGTTRFSAYVAGNTTTVEGYDSSGTLRLSVSFNLGVSQYTGTFYHVLVSVNKTSTATRSVYVNDVLQSATWDTYSTANNIDFTTPIHSVMGLYGTTAAAAGRLSNLFLDKTYRDLSVTANRRLFVTADLKPAAGQAALNPILYLPMDDPTQPGLNAGTGGNFTLTGTVARSGRGPNQYNAPYSDLDGSADYLERASVTGMANTSTFTFACSFILDVTTNSYIAQCGGNEFAVRVQSGQLRLLCYATGSVLLVNATVDITGGFVVGRNYTVTISIDTTNSSKRHVYVNGTAATVTWSTYTSGSIYFAQTWRIGREATTPYFNGRLGAVYFNTSYIDLSVAANLAKFVSGTGIDAKPVDLGASGELPTGTSPLIYLPMYGNNAGKNYGTGGDFTVNSGPYAGARGPNEYWGNLATFNGTNSYLSKSGAISGLSNSKTFSLSLFFNKTSGATTDYLISWPTTGGNHTLFFNTATSMNQSWRNTLGNAALGGWTPTIPDATNVHLLICVDMDDVNKCKIYINGTVHAGTPGTFVTGTTLDFASINNPFIGVFDSASLSSVFNGKLSEFYFTNQYIDFTQEANRLKFRDAFGNPVDLTQQIEDAAIPNPAIYMRFPPTAFGTNYGTGGDFTVNGTITDGGQL